MSRCRVRLSQRPPPLQCALGPQCTPNSCPALSFIMHQFRMTLTFNIVHHIAPHIASHFQFNLYCANTKGPTLYCIHDVSAPALALKDHLPPILHWIICTPKKKLLHMHGEDVWSLTCSLSFLKIGHIRRCTHWEAPMTHNLDWQGSVSALVAICPLNPTYESLTFTMFKSGMFDQHTCMHINTILES